MNPSLAQWNTLAPDEAARQVLPCCGSQAWASQLAAKRPILSLDGLAATSDRIWASLPLQDQLEAFASHPRIGERHASAAARSLAWSSLEQSAAFNDQTAQAALAEANRRYEEKFDRTFVVCATGKSASEILSILQNRLYNTPEQELAEAAEQQRQITHLRLHKWLEGR